MSDADWDCRNSITTREQAVQMMASYLADRPNDLKEVMDFAAKWKIPFDVGLWVHLQAEIREASADGYSDWVPSSAHC